MVQIDVNIYNRVRTYFVNSVQRVDTEKAVILQDLVGFWLEKINNKTMVSLDAHNIVQFLDADNANELEDLVRQLNQIYLTIFNKASMTTSNELFTGVNSSNWQTYLRLMHFIQQFYHANGLAMFNICPDFKLAPFHITLSKTNAKTTKVFEATGEQSLDNFASIFDSLVVEKYQRGCQWLVDYTASLKQQFYQLSKRAGPCPGIEIQGTQAEEPEDLVTFELSTSKRRLRSDTSANPQKRQRKSLQQMYRQGDDCPGDPSDLEFAQGQQELVIHLGDYQLWEEDDQNEISDELEDLLDEIPDDEEIGDAPEQEYRRDHRWLNNPAFPQIDITDPDLTFVGIDPGVVFRATSCIIKASPGNDVLQTLQSSDKNAIPSVMLNSQEFRARIRAELSQQDRELSEDLLMNERPLYLDLSVQKAKFTKYLLKGVILKEYAARLVGLNSFDDSRKKKIVVFWGSSGIKRFGRVFLPGGRYHPACKQLLQYVQQMATVYVSHEKGTSNHCSDCEQRVVRRRTAERDVVTCGNCHLVINGDVNAAINIIKIGLTMATNHGMFPMQFTL
ncbi:hypothetical protein MIR68_009819 [Amoeboaphelidium protococcarum]|nr:hypothetical protein MIR68_009819 [Amoeboaphelidium protococcarum]